MNNMKKNIALLALWTAYATASTADMDLLNIPECPSASTHPLSITEYWPGRLNLIGIERPTASEQNAGPNTENLNIPQQHFDELYAAMNAPGCYIPHAHENGPNENEGHHTKPDPDDVLNLWKVPKYETPANYNYSVMPMIYNGAAWKPTWLENKLLLDRIPTPSATTDTASNPVYSTNAPSELTPAPRKGGRTKLTRAPEWVTSNAKWPQALLDAERLIADNEKAFNAGKQFFSEHLKSVLVDYCLKHKCTEDPESIARLQLAYLVAIQKNLSETNTKYYAKVKHIFMLIRHNLNQSIRKGTVSLITHKVMKLVAKGEATAKGRR